MFYILRSVYGFLHREVFLILFYFIYLMIEGYKYILHTYVDEGKK